MDRAHGFIAIDSGIVTAMFTLFTWQMESGETSAVWVGLMTAYNNTEGSMSCRGRDDDEGIKAVGLMVVVMCYSGATVMEAWAAEAMLVEERMTGERGRDLFPPYHALHPSAAPYPSM